MLLNGNPDPSKAAREPDDVARLKLSQALDRATYAIAWERTWPQLVIHDPWALRGLVVVMMAAAYVAAGDERNLRIASAFDWNGVLTPANIRVDAWVTPPVYTGKPPIILSSASKESAVPSSGP